MNDDKTLTVGVFVPTATALWSDHRDPREAIAFGVQAEKAGLDSLWVTDSLLTPRLEALTALAALAPVTDTVTLGTAALLPALRSPVPAAQTLASVDLLSGGRLTLGVGAGFLASSASRCMRWARRFKRLDEIVALWRELWTREEPFAFHGEVLDFTDLVPQTPTSRPSGIPIWLGGATPAALARTGRLYDGWLPYPPDPADYAAGLTAIHASAEAAHRSPDAIDPALFVNVLVTSASDGGRSELDTYFRGTYGWPIEQMEQLQAHAAGTLDAVTEKLTQYVAAGARKVVIRIAALTIDSQLAQLEHLTKLRSRLNSVVVGNHWPVSRRNALTFDQLSSDAGALSADRRRTLG
ncbi:alkanesulfonate monooxygenase SsuD/methylene tetrahydromethanopterin reductase-like flavin-dependent oxidoreductase (luciferase family) [Kribbella voronezhensis]|uniref:Alkanesulfonate monooxygenase SsuD/methylene tetrahydromethanopterin reductase-like flavin-dependent oxidoreductase (Luciferase family) n=1 Tax=Kribbella voronezhensis TaxID=2512212 RepID=A0A4R7TJH2_9ACTN|nr:LLM class flavin-dependent oxidoreductase [Kribbella voronezhensis]TDU91707.1 alkanesulfonate monooxygenase SsuD/methylene tetrahydromethanopterin reductase-like flavin-dependent oxidoreductase (luciferase family) [Kribbella voronezhensis]